MIGGAATNGASRKERLQSALVSALARMLEVEPSEIDANEPLIEMGADSLTLVGAIRDIQRTFGVKLRVRQFFEELSTLEAVAQYLDEALPLDAEARPLASEAGRDEPECDGLPTATAAAENLGEPGRAITDASDDATLESFLSQQLEVLSRVIQEQLRVIGESAATPGMLGRGTHRRAHASCRRAPVVALEARDRVEGGDAATTAAPREPPPEAERKRPGRGRLDASQQRYLEAFATAYTERTRRSKQAADAFRQVSADNRRSMHFRRTTKEMGYPIVAERSQGARIWDVDGNEYVDLAMGFGALLFGHRPAFLIEALHAQIERGIHLGPQSDLVGPTARLVCELTAMERTAFCVTGAEAVMMALRLARTATGRQKVVLFEGAFHGHYDGTLVAAAPHGERTQSIPAVPGIPEGVARDVIVLEYGSSASLDVLEECIGEVAAVLVEPVQQRRPDWIPRRFLGRLRELTVAHGAALVFDEVLTGFRPHPRGVQGLLGVEADMATYGKVVGSGLPIGIVAGKALYLDGIDGGAWCYGDDSYPAAERTYHAGTYKKHPLCMAAAHAVLRELKRRGPGLQEELNERTARLADSLNALFAERRAPIRVAHLGSLFRFESRADLDLFFLHLIDRGVYVWEGRTCYLSTEHGEAETRAIRAAVEESLAALQAVGLLVDVEAPRSVRPAEPVRRVPLSVEQQELWTSAEIEREASVAMNLGLGLRLRGRFEPVALRRAVQEVIARHESLRTTFSTDGGEAIVHPSLELEIPLADWSGLGPDEAETRLRELMLAESRFAFDRVRGPLLHVQLVRLAEEDHVLLVCWDHLIGDGLSLGIFLRDLGRLYLAERDGHAAGLEPALQFHEYADWRRDWLAGPGAEVARKFWSAHLEGSVGVLDLPYDRPRPRLKSYPGDHRLVRFDAATLEALKGFGRRHRATLLMTLLTAFKTLLHRLSRHGDIVVGVPLAVRGLPGSEETIGSCANLGAVRTRIEGDPRFLEYLDQVRSALLDISEHEGLPLSRLSRRGCPDVHPAASSRLYSVYFNIEPVPNDLDLGCEIDWVPFPVEFCHPDLVFNFVQIRDELMLHVSFNTDLLDADTVLRWVDHFRSLLRDALSDPEQPLSALELLSDRERALAKEVASGGKPATPATEELGTAVASRALHSPESPAIACGDRRLGYADLDRAVRERRRSCRRGESPPLVGARRERGDPVDRVVALVALGEGAAQRGIVASLREVHRLEPGARVGVACAAPSELPAWTLLWPLSRGATLVLRPQPDSEADPTLAAWIRDQRLHMLFTDPGGLRELVDAEWTSPSPDLRRVVCAGSPLPAELRERFAERFAADLVAHYVPESGGSPVSIWSDDGAPVRHRGRAWIGRPLPGAELHVLDERRRPTPLGVSGRLYVSSRGGSEASFRAGDAGSPRRIPHPFDRSGEPLVRTDELARRHVDGSIESLGRADEELRIHGFCIDPVAIEARLRAQPELEDAVVISRPLPGGAQRLLACVVRAAGRDVSRAELRRRLREQLPESLVAPEISMVDCLPRNAEGKLLLDAEHLASADLPRTSEYVAPRDDLERELVSIWEEVLGEGPVGVRDNFFDLGGHSLLSLQLLRRIQQRHDLALSISGLLSDPTVENMAGLIRRGGRTSPAGHLVPLQTRGRAAPLYLVHAIDGSVLAYAELARLLGPHQPVFGIQASGLDATSSPLDDVGSMAERYLGSVREQQSEGPYRLVGWSMGGMIAFEMARRLQASGREVSLLALLDPPAPAGARVTASQRNIERAVDRWLSEAGLTGDPGAPQRLIARAREAGLLPPELDLDSARGLLPVLEHHQRAVRRYRPGRYAGKVLIVRPEESGGSDPVDADGGWADVVQGDVEIARVPGNHFSMMRRPHVQGLAGHLKAALEGVDGAG